MICCGPHVLAESNVVLRAEAALGSRLVGRFSGVLPHSSLESLAAATEATRVMRPDVIVSVGGGSTVTIAKGAALLMNTDRDVRDFRIKFLPPDEIVKPSFRYPEVTAGILAIGTTMGCAEIGSSGGGFADAVRQEKLIISANGSTRPRTVFCDGEALVTTPDLIQRSTTAGQLRVAIESFITRRHNPVGDGLAIHAIRLLCDAIEETWRRDPHYLLRIKMAAVLASTAMGAVGTLGVNSAIAHQLGAITGASHGSLNAVLLPHTLRYGLIAVPLERRQMLANALGMRVPSEPRLNGALVDKVSEIFQSLELPGRLRDLSVARSLFPAVAQATLDDRALWGSARVVKSVAPIIEILESAW